MNEIKGNFEAKGHPGFPGIIGVIDGTHIRIRAPTRQPDAYVNRKKFHSLVTQIVCDDNMIFRDILVGWPGSVHDARVLRNSSLSATAATKFPGNTHLLGDGGYPLKSWLITPFRDNGRLNARQKQFNTKLSALRSVVERSICLLKGRWRKLLCLEHTDMAMLVHLIMSACVLHNFCLLNDDYDENYFLDIDDGDDGAADNGVAVGHLGGGAFAAEAKRVHLMNIIC
ncbi:putative nuclease HARBI1 [Acropora muricata]